LRNPAPGKLVTLQHMLIRMFWISLLPLLLFAAYLVLSQVRDIDRLTERNAQHRLLNTNTLIENLIDSQIRCLQILAHSPLLDEPQRLEQFYRTAQGFRSCYGMDLILADNAMQMLLNTGVPFGTALPALPKPRAGGFAAAPSVLQTGQPAVSNIVDHPETGAPLVAVVVPLLREGTGTQLLISAMDARQIVKPLDTIRLPPGWVLSVIDGNGQTIARHPQGAAALADDAVDRLSQPIAVTGDRWRIMLEIDRAARRASLYRAMVVLGAGLLAALVIAFLLSRGASRSIVTAVGSLADSGGSAGVSSRRIAEVEAIRGRLDLYVQSLRDSEERYRELFASNPHPMWVYDLETLRFLAVNAAAVAQYGYSESEFLAMTIADIRPPEDVPRLQAHVAARGGQAAFGFDRAGIWRHVRKDGSLIDVEITAQPLMFAGRRAEAVLALDVTERMNVEQRIAHYVERLEKATLGTAEAISRTMDMRDPYTAGHERRVGAIAAAIAAEMGLSADVQRGLRVAGDLHDIGKMTVPAEILVKPTRLTPNELLLIREHPAKGHDVLKSIDFPWPVAEVAWQHHERLDGSGYPRGLKGDEILPEARILAVGRGGGDVLAPALPGRPRHRTRTGRSRDPCRASLRSRCGCRLPAAVPGKRLPHPGLVPRRAQSARAPEAWITLAYFSISRLR